MRRWNKHAAAAALVAVLAVGLGCSRDQDPPPQAADEPAPASQRAETTPEPWEYDEARGRHWHPGHGHWHPGPPPEGVEAPPADAQEAAEEADLQWHTSLPDALEAAKQTETLVLVNAHAEWCGWCKKLDEETLSHPDVQERLQDFALLKIDTDRQSELARRLGVTGLPTTLVLDATGKVVLSRSGFMPPKDYLELLEGVETGGPVKGQEATPSLPEAAASAEETAPLEAGDRAPSVTVKDEEGRSRDLSRLVAEKPAVIVFYRGGWCPYCTTHLGELATVEPRLVEIGYQVLAISADRPDKVRETQEKSHFRYQLLSDNRMEAACAFGVAFKVDKATVEAYEEHGIDLEAASGETHRLLPVPSVFVVGTDGVIKFAHSNPDYKVRLEPDKILAAAESAAR